jgi:prefoldin subunit 5
MEHTVYRLINIYKSKKIQLIDELNKYDQEIEEIKNTMKQLQIKEREYNEFIEELEKIRIDENIPKQEVD